MSRLVVCAFALVVARVDSKIVGAQQRGERVDGPSAVFVHRGAGGEQNLDSLTDSIVEPRLARFIDR